MHRHRYRSVNRDLKHPGNHDEARAPARDRSCLSAMNKFVLCVLNHASIDSRYNTPSVCVCVCVCTVAPRETEETREIRAWRNSRHRERVRVHVHFLCQSKIGWSSSFIPRLAACIISVSNCGKRERERERERERVSFSLLTMSGSAKCIDVSGELNVLRWNMFFTLHPVEWDFRCGASTVVACFFGNSRSLRVTF